MRKRSGLAVLRPYLPALLALAIPAAISLPLVAIAGDGASGGSAGAKRADAGEERHDPNNITGISRWMELCVEGNGKYLVRDYPGAIESYKSAVRLAPKNPYPHYLLGEAHLASGNLTEADASFKQAEQASDKRDALLRAKILFVTADLKERQKKWDEAKVGWQQYNEWVFAQSDGGTYPLSAAARIKAIDDVLKLDKATQIVRERIAAPASPGGSSDAGAAKTPEAGSKSAPPKK